jgi:hypothetical protein
MVSREPMTVTGWCNTGHHSKCPKDVLLWGDENQKRTCSCACHGDSPANKVEEKQRGVCGVCGGEYARHKNGTLRAHKNGAEYCTGK